MLLMSSASSIEAFLLPPYPLEFDLETTSLKADYGLALVVGVRPFRVRSRRATPVQFILETRAKNWELAERRMLRDVERFLRGYFKDGPVKIITFNGTRFDVPFLQARLAAQGLPLLPKMRHLDLYYTVKRTFGYTVTSRRAKYIEAIFQAGDVRAPHKDSSQIFTWSRATFSRDRAAFARIVAHNRDECLASLDYQTRRLLSLAPRTVPLR
jgi:uncharacterized protein YprB with RNaseH-like and TPR domain